MLHLLPTTLLFLFLSSPLIYAGDVGEGGTCQVNNNRLQLGTYEFSSDCNPLTFCNSQGKCEKKGCRRDEFPFGYSPGATLPDRCQDGHFCPDEQDRCQEKLPVGSDCQLNRDGTMASSPQTPKKVLISARLDECQPPPDAKDLKDTSPHGLNVDGAVCLNFKCM